MLPAESMKAFIGLGGKIGVLLVRKVGGGLGGSHF